MFITEFYAGVLAILFFALSIRVVAVRGRVSLGDGGDPMVLRRMRGHANFAEYVPLILLNGAEWFAKLGPEKNGGPKLYCVSGHVKKPGVYEAAMNTTLRNSLSNPGDT